MKGLVASALAQLQSADLKAPFQAARWLWHDSIGCAYSGYRAAPLQALLAQQVLYAPGAFIVPGATQGVNLQAAAFLNAMAICHDEACEGLALAHGRPGVPIVAALWPLALSSQASWRQVLEASIFGYQLGGTLGAYLRIRPGMHVDGVWPALGVAAALAYFLRLTPAQTVDALECCASQLPASLYLPVRQGSLARNTYLGHSAWLGLTAVMTAAAGIEGPEGAAQEYAARVLLSEQSGPIPGFSDFLIEQSYWKPYACVRHVQYGASAAAALRSKVQGQAESEAIEAIRLSIYPEAITYCGNRAPRHLISAQFSLSYGVAAMLRYGDLSPQQFAESCLHDPLTQRLESMVELRELPVVGGSGAPRSCRLEVLYHGVWISASCDGIPGDPGHPVSQAQRDDKFSRYCGMQADALQLGQRMLQADYALGAAAVLKTTDLTDRG